MKFRDEQREEVFRLKRNISELTKAENPNLRLGLQVVPLLKVTLHSSDRAKKTLSVSK